MPVTNDHPSVTDEIDGHPVTEYRVKLTKAGDGLSESLQIDDHRLSAGDEVTLILRGIVGGPGHHPRTAGNFDGDYVRVDNIVTQSATIVENALVDDIMAEHEAAVAELREQEKERKLALKRLPFDDTTDDAQHAEDDGLTPDNVSDIRP